MLGLRDARAPENARTPLQIVRCVPGRCSASIVNARAGLFREVLSGYARMTPTYTLSDDWPFPTHFDDHDEDLRLLRLETILNSVSYERWHLLKERPDLQQESGSPFDALDALHAPPTPWACGEEERERANIAANTRFVREVIVRSSVNQTARESGVAKHTILNMENPAGTHQPSNASLEAVARLWRLKSVPISCADFKRHPNDFRLKVRRPK